MGPWIHEFSGDADAKRVFGFGFVFSNCGSVGVKRSSALDRLGFKRLSPQLSSSSRTTLLCNGFSSQKEPTFCFLEMAVVQPSYEKFRQQRLEENKKRMEDLKLTALSQSLLQSPSKSSPSKQAKHRVNRREEEVFFEVRRSSRVAQLPPADYKEKKLDLGERPRRFYGRRSSLLNRVYASDEVRVNAIERAELIQSNLEPEFPSFVKPMLQSHVTGGFWLGLPNQFCKSYLPKTDASIILEDEEGEEFTTVYLGQKTGLSGGWRGFAMSHDLVDGDALVFQLVKPTKFKVYIVRGKDVDVIDSGVVDISSENVGAKRHKVR